MAGTCEEARRQGLPLLCELGGAEVVIQWWVWQERVIAQCSYDEAGAVEGVLTVWENARHEQSTVELGQRS